MVTDEVGHTGSPANGTDDTRLLSVWAPHLFKEDEHEQAA